MPFYFTFQEYKSPKGIIIMNALQLIENTYTDISVETIHQHIEYDTTGFEDCDEGVLGLSIMWDYENEEIDDLMENEHHPK